jgi:hypothetical protein
MAIVNLYQCTWRRNDKKAPEIYVNFVSAAANASAISLASTIQTANGDGKAVTVDEVHVVKTGIIQ